MGSLVHNHRSADARSVGAEVIAVDCVASLVPHKMALSKKGRHLEFSTGGSSTLRSTRRSSPLWSAGFSRALSSWRGCLQTSSQFLRQRVRRWGHERGAARRPQPPGLSPLRALSGLQARRRAGSTPASATSIVEYGTTATYRTSIARRVRCPTALCLCPVAKLAGLPRSHDLDRPSP